MDPDVSILIPVRNMGKTLLRAVASVADGVSEIIIIDDGSTDETPARIQLLGNSYPDWRIRSVEQGARGVGAALNAGLKIAKGRLIMRQDADDVSYSSRLQMLKAAINTYYNECNAIASWFAHQRTDKVHHGMVHAFPPLLTTEDLLSGWRFPHAAAMYRRDALEQIGGWPEDMDCCEDHLLHLRLSRLGPLAILPHVLYFIGNSPDRQTRVKDTALWDDYAVRKFKEESA